MKNYHRWAMLEFFFEKIEKIEKWHVEGHKSLQKSKMAFKTD